MTQQRPELAAYVITALCIIAIVVLTLQNKVVPDVLNFVAAGAIGIGGGVTMSTARYRSE